ncbi:MAG: RNase adapter RapZ [Magnetococcales bacterium]|nr:RNase adapter RapZ [Magnetococcales bacterium]
MTTTSSRIDHLILLTGFSGAGKSSALKYLEDIGFLWVDNMPIPLIPKLVDQILSEALGSSRVVVGVHLRNQESLSAFHACYNEIIHKAVRFEMVFFEADFDVLISRYRETRRRHPLVRDHTVKEAVAMEMADLEPIRAMADTVVDTSRMTVPALKEHLNQLFHHNSGSDLLVFIRSFGFKFGSNSDADMVLDARFLPNPFYDTSLRAFCGKDPQIIQFLEEDGEALTFIEHLTTLFNYLLPRYRREKKRYFTVDIGCTGGRHRSVYLVERLAGRLREEGYQVILRHRDLDRESLRFAGEK